MTETTLLYALSILRADLRGSGSMVSCMDDHDEIEHLRREVRRLKGQVRALEEEKEDLYRRYTFICQELEWARAKIRTS